MSCYVNVSQLVLSIKLKVVNKIVKPQCNRLQLLTKPLSLLYEIGFIDYRSRFHISSLFYSKFSIGMLSSYGQKSLMTTVRVSLITKMRT